MPQATDLPAHMEAASGIVEISSDHAQESVESDEQAVEAGENLVDQSSSPPPEDSDGHTPEDATMHAEASPVPEVSVDHAAPEAREQPTGSRATPCRGFDDQFTDQNPVPLALSVRSTPHGKSPTRSSSVRSVSAGVRKTKSKSRQQAPQGAFISPRYGQQQIQPASPTEEDLLYLLMHRSRQNTAMNARIAEKANTKLKTLEHRVFELHTESKTYRQERDDILAAHTELTENHDLLQAKLEDFSAKYTKLKNFARSTYDDFLSLHKDSEKQNDSVQRLRQHSQQVKASIGEVTSGLHNARSTLDTHVKDLASVRSETQQAFSQLGPLSSTLDAKSLRVRELKRENERLQAHVVTLEHAQQRASQASRHVNENVGSVLEQVVSRLDMIERNALKPSNLPDYLGAIGQCSNLIIDLQKRKQISTADFDNLFKTVTTLENTVSRGIVSIGSELQTLQSAKTVETPNLLDPLKQYVEDLQLSAIHLQQSDANKVRLEERLKASESMKEQLQKSAAQSESHATSIQRILHSKVIPANGHQQQLAYLEQQNEQTLLRWNQAKSELAKTKQELANEAQEVFHAAFTVLCSSG